MAYTVEDSVGGFDNNGVFHRVENWVSDKNAGVKILAESMDLECDNFAAGFNNCLTRDGKGKPQADINFDGNTGINIGADLHSHDSIATMAIAITDPTRVFYDISASPDHIELFNDYLDTPALCADDGYHFFVVVKNTITVQDFSVFYATTTILANRHPIGGDGAPMPSSTIKSKSVHHCVLYSGQGQDEKYIVFLTSGIGGGGGGRVDEIKNGTDPDSGEEDGTIVIDNTDPIRPTIRVDKDEVVGNVVKTINGLEPDRGDFPNVVLKDRRGKTTEIPFDELQIALNDRNSLQMEGCVWLLTDWPGYPVDLNIDFSNTVGSRGHTILFNNGQGSPISSMNITGMGAASYSFQTFFAKNIYVDATNVGGIYSFGGHVVSWDEYNNGTLLKSESNGTVILDRCDFTIPPFTIPLPVEPLMEMNGLGGTMYFGEHSTLPQQLLSMQDIYLFKVGKGGRLLFNISLDFQCPDKYIYNDGEGIIMANGKIISPNPLT
jgi:hypothetical protein